MGLGCVFLNYSTRKWSRVGWNTTDDLITSVSKTPGMDLLPINGQADVQVDSIIPSAIFNEIRHVEAIYMSPEGAYLGIHIDSNLQIASIGAAANWLYCAGSANWVDCGHDTTPVKVTATDPLWQPGYQFTLTPDIGHQDVSFTIVIEDAAS